MWYGLDHSAARIGQQNSKKEGRSNKNRGKRGIQIFSNDPLDLGASRTRNRTPIVDGGAIKMLWKMTFSELEKTRRAPHNIAEPGNPDPTKKSRERINQRNCGKYRVKWKVYI